MQLGTSKAIITPPIGTPLAGYASRDHGSESVLDDLEIRVLWFEPEDAPQQAACIVTADIIGFDSASVSYPAKRQPHTLRPPNVREYAGRRRC
jgi:hypothetical protein